MTDSNWYIRRLHKAVRRRERRVEKIQAKIERAKQRHANGKVTRATLQRKSMNYEARIRALKARIQLYRGAIGKERRRLEEIGA